MNPTILILIGFAINISSIAIKNERASRVVLAHGTLLIFTALLQATLMATIGGGSA